jgi:restriction system protein
MARIKGQAEFVQWMGPLLDALRAMGGSAKPRECSDWIAEHLQLAESVTESRIKSGAEKFHNQVQWARQYLVWEGLIDSPQRGVWTLTPRGASTRLSPEASRKLFLKWVEIHHPPKKPKPENRLVFCNRSRLKVLNVSASGFSTNTVWRK